MFIIHYLKCQPGDKNNLRPGLDVMTMTARTPKGYAYKNMPLIEVLLPTVGVENMLEETCQWKLVIEMAEEVVTAEAFFSSGMTINVS